jgi:hypothetical protein
VGVGNVVTANVSVGTTGDGLSDHSSQFVLIALGDTVSVTVTVTVAAFGQVGTLQSLHCDDVGLGELLVVTAKVTVGNVVLDCEMSQSFHCDDAGLGGIWLVTAKVMVGKVVLGCEMSQSFHCDDAGLGRIWLVAAKVMVEKEVLEDRHSCHSACTGVAAGLVVRAKVIVGGVDEEEAVHSTQLKSVVADVLVVTAYSIVGNVDELRSSQGIQTVIPEGSYTIDEVIGGAAALVTANAAVVGISVDAGFHSFHTDSTVLCEGAGVAVNRFVVGVGA